MVATSAMTSGSRFFQLGILDLSSFWYSPPSIWRDA
ncbi:Uncharacterised protein [Bordetella pertussis]|nr:Uncharacterised protein [Bordetella pertussis]CFW45560.1 Uncharacterised protein [Bordetella pertussis]CPK49962.1 Uncharacterised protein [Bordetella pertussis]